MLSLLIGYYIIIIIIIIDIIIISIIIVINIFFLLLSQSEEFALFTITKAQTITFLWSIYIQAEQLSFLNPGAFTTIIFQF